MARAIVTEPLLTEMLGERAASILAIRIIKA